MMASRRVQPGGGSGWKCDDSGDSAGEKTLSTKKQMGNEST
jgi:hypothetical protein